MSLKGVLYNDNAYCVTILPATYVYRKDVEDLLSLYPARSAWWGFL